LPLLSKKQGKWRQNWSMRYKSTAYTPLQLINHWKFTPHCIIIIIIIMGYRLPHPLVLFLRPYFVHLYDGMCYHRSRTTCSRSTICMKTGSSRRPSSRPPAPSWYESTVSHVTPTVTFLCTHNFGWMRGAKRFALRLLSIHHWKFGRV